ncbi:hypothetical protein NGTWS1803_22330 [Mycolicibacterium cyprinidarum]|nr:hypothetical protein NGTWS1803_22330 [Mycolicibacterium sp. NGTWS1803]
MALIAHSATARARWTLTALLRRLQPTVSARRIKSVSLAVDDVAAEAAVHSNRPRRAKRSYPPPRDSLLEQTTMAREMFRL